MSMGERRRMSLMRRVSEGVLKVREAAEMMRVSYRQAKRILQRYRQEGDEGLVNRSRGRRSNRSCPAGRRERAVKLYIKHYEGFGPLLASEHLLSDHAMEVNPETLRLWLVSAGHWKPRCRRAVHRAARQRRPRRGDLVQMDGSEHDWFEGRGPRAVLMVMIDDATNRTLARFYTAEDTAAAYDIFARYTELYGLPAALYPDRDSIYVCTREACLEEQLANVGPETQFGRAMRELGVDLITAHSPQAKGRVERRHQVFQDRLVKEMRLLGICTIEAANAYLDDTFLAMINERYTLGPADHANGHLPRPAAMTLALALSWQEPRIVAKDWTLRWRNRRLQIDARHAKLNLPGRRVMVVERRDGTLGLLYDKRLLTFREVPAAPAIKPVPKTPSGPRVPHPIPAADHPWRRYPDANRPGPLPPPTSNRAHSRGKGPRAATASRQRILTT